jgi:hypothetical protein
MITESPNFGEIKQTLINTIFSPIDQHGFNVQDYEQHVVCAKIQNQVDSDELLKIIDLYTSGNNGAIISPGPVCGDKIEQWVIMPPETARELKVNLRCNSPKKNIVKGKSGGIS